MATTTGLDAKDILEAIGEGVYATDINRRIVYWSRAAERITGWSAGQILGKCCYDDILCHIDKDGHRLCGEDYCPLHRSIITGQSSVVPIIVFAQTPTGGRVPLTVSVAPIRNAAGEITGGVETFRDLSAEFADLQRVRKIQSLALQAPLPEDPRIRFATRHVPRDIIGGDYYGIAKLDADRYGILLADVTGHGVPAALYTMCLNSLWEANHHLLKTPLRFAEAVNEGLQTLIQEAEPFAAAICGLFDLTRQELTLVGAGNPPPLVARKGRDWEHPEACGLPFGVMQGADYEQRVLPIHPGDRVLFFTDGVTEIADRKGELLGPEGLERILANLGYPEADVPFPAIEEALLQYSDRIRFDDDLTLVEVRIL